MGSRAGIQGRWHLECFTVVGRGLRPWRSHVGGNKGPSQIVRSSAGVAARYPAAKPARALGCEGHDDVLHAEEGG